MLRSAVPPDGMPVEAHIFTDVQKTSMPSPFAELAVPPGTTAHRFIRSQARQEPNWYVENVNAPRSVYQPKKVRVQAVVAGAGHRKCDT